MSISRPERNQPGDGESEESLKKAFAVRLRRLREERGKTQNQVAKALGFASESVYQLWEKEKGDGNLPSAHNLRKLARYFKVSADYLLDLPEARRGTSPVGGSGEEDQEERRKLEVFQLAMQGKNWDAPETAALLRAIQRQPLETLSMCYDRVLTDVIYPPRPKNLPRLSDFYTPAAQQAKEEIERLFLQRPAGQARRVMMYVLDLRQVPSSRLQRNILGMQGAELIKRRRAYTLGISNGRMARDVLFAPNLVRGDIQDVMLIPLVLGRSQSDATAATTIIGDFVFRHGDYGVERVPLKDEMGWKRIAMLAGSIDLAFMGIGSLEPEDKKSLFTRLLEERAIDPAELRGEGVIGNVLFHLIRENASGTSWDVYDRPDGKHIRVDIGDDNVEEDVLHTLSLDTLRELVEVRQAHIVITVTDPPRARIVRAALEMGWANSVICSLEVAEALSALLRPSA